VGKKDDSNADPIVYISERFKVDIDFIRYAKGEYLEKLHDEKNGSVVSYKGNLWNVEIVTIIWPFEIQDISENHAEAYVTSLVKAFKQNDHKRKEEIADMTLRVVFSKDETGIWHDQDEVVDFNIG
jgi:hypothetical protein